MFSHTQYIVNYDTRRRHAFFVFVMIFLCFQGGIAQSKVVENLRKSDLAHRTFVLYPSTLRMVNVAKIESYYKTIEQIEKALFFKLRDKFTEHDYLKTVAQLQDDENFEELMQLDQSGEDKLLVLHQEESSETVFLAKRGDQYYAGTLFGKIDLLQLVELVGDIQDPEIIKNNPLLETLYNSGFAKRKDRNRDEDEDEDDDSDDQEKTANDKKSKT